MRRFPALLFATIVLIFGVAGKCSKGGGGGTPTPPEANLAVTLNPPVGSNQAAALGPDFPLSVTITSTMPPQGVTIEVTAKVENATTNFYAPAITSTSATVSNFTITNTPVASTCVVTVTVTSKTKATNKWTGSYRYSRK
ncbi:MAG: hypothetical protein JNN29_00450 [Chitinophagaceae bacterium]|nr:hypothetical protein [Chitinophagaceae bacterium]MBN8666493.1 hypothetical protein [Chitinophagales bacterium]